MTTEHSTSTVAYKETTQIDPSLWKNYLLQQMALGGKELCLEISFVPVDKAKNHRQTTPSKPELQVSKEPSRLLRLETDRVNTKKDSNSMSLLEQFQQKLQKESPSIETTENLETSNSKKQQDKEASNIVTSSKVKKEWNTLEEYYTYLSELDLYKDKPIVKASDTSNFGSPLITVVSMAPEDTDVETVFSGEAGSLWKKMLQAINIDFTQTYTTALIKNAELAKTTSWRDKNKYIPHLLHELEEKKPTHLILLGEELAQLLLKTGNSIEKLKRQTHFLSQFAHFESALDNTHSSSYSIYKINTYTLLHPSTLLQNPEQKRNTWENLQWIQTQLPLN